MNNTLFDTGGRSALNTIPEGRLAIIPLKSTAEIGRKVDEFLVQWRRDRVLHGVISGENG